MYYFDPYPLVAIATNIPQRLKTLGFVLQGHTFSDLLVSYSATSSLFTLRLKRCFTSGLFKACFLNAQYALIEFGCILGLIVNIVINMLFSFSYAH